MKQSKLLNQLIDQIDLIDGFSYSIGYAEGLNKYSLTHKIDRQLAKAKTKAFKIIDLLSIQKEK